jgi:hypothetical protein
MLASNVKKSNVWIDEIFEKVREFKLSRSLYNFFSILIWLMLQREYTLSQYDCFFILEVIMIVYVNHGYHIGKRDTNLYLNILLPAAYRELPVCQTVTYTSYELTGFRFVSFFLFVFFFFFLYLIMYLLGSCKKNSIYNFLQELIYSHCIIKWYSSPTSMNMVILTEVTSLNRYQM